MKGTPILPAAYDKSMQPIVLILLLMMTENNAELGAAMQKFLAFYRENRALIMALAEAPGGAQPETPDGGAPFGQGASAAQGQEKSRPEESSSQTNILEEYLKHAAVR